MCKGHLSVFNPTPRTNAARNFIYLSSSTNDLYDKKDVLSNQLYLVEITFDWLKCNFWAIGPL